MIARTLATLRRAAHAAPIASTIFVLALLASLFFGVRAAMFHWDRPGAGDPAQPIAAWMTPRYIARTWDVPPDILLETLNIERTGDGRPPTLEKIARDRGIPVETLIAEIETALRAFRATTDGTVAR